MTHITTIGSLKTYCTKAQWELVRTTVDKLMQRHEARHRSWPGRPLNASHEERVDAFISFLGNWTVKQNSRASRWGQCSYDNREIQLSWRLRPGGDFTQRHDGTLMHEIAHALAYFILGCHGHGPVWKEIDQMLGNDGSRCTAGPKEADLSTARVAYECPCCKKKVIRSRRFDNRDRVGRPTNRSCGTCSPRVYKEEYRLVLVKG